MAFADPLPNVTWATAPQTLPFIARDGDPSKKVVATYRKSDGSLEIRITQDTYREANIQRFRARILALHTINAVDPANAEAGNKDFVMRHEFVFDRPGVVFTQTQYKDLITLVKDFLTSGNMDKLFSRES